jgi:hypothetical protein
LLTALKTTSKLDAVLGDLDKFVQMVVAEYDQKVLKLDRSQWIDAPSLFWCICGQYKFSGDFSDVDLGDAFWVFDEFVLYAKGSGVYSSEVRRCIVLLLSEVWPGAHMAESYFSCIFSSDEALEKLGYRESL